MSATPNRANRLRPQEGVEPTDGGPSPGTTRGPIEPIGRTGNQPRGVTRGSLAQRGDRPSGTGRDRCGSGHGIQPLTCEISSGSGLNGMALRMVTPASANAAMRSWMKPGEPIKFICSSAATGTLASASVFLPAR